MKSMPALFIVSLSLCLAAGTTKAEENSAVCKSSNVVPIIVCRCRAASRIRIIDAVISTIPAISSLDTLI